MALVDTCGSRSPSPVRRNYEEELVGVFGDCRTKWGSAEKGVRESGDEVLSLKRRLVEQELSFESEKFKLVHDFTLKLREEERNRVNLLSKVAELEGIKLRLEKELFEGMSSGVFQNSSSGVLEGMKAQVEQLSEENRRLRAEVGMRVGAGSNEAEYRIEAERLRTQVRILERELSTKQDELSKAQKTLATQQHETRFLREEMNKQELDITEMRRDHMQLGRENAILRQETQRLNVENNRLVQRLREYADQTFEARPKDYLALQQRLEDTSLRIKSLEEQIVQTSENYEELRQHASVTQKPKGRSGSRSGNRSTERPSSRSKSRLRKEAQRNGTEGKHGKKK